MTTGTLTLRKASTRTAGKPNTAGSRITRKTKKQGSGTLSETFAIDRHRMIAEAAYSLAEQRGFQPGQEIPDWLAAEKEIDALLGKAANMASS